LTCWSYWADVNQRGEGKKRETDWARVGLAGERKVGHAGNSAQKG
jgi:hypothetical protein